MLLRTFIVVLSLQLMPSDLDDLRKLCRLSQQEHAVLLCYGRQQNWVMYVRGGHVEELNKRVRSGHTFPALSPDMRYLAFGTLSEEPQKDAIILLDLKEKTRRELVRRLSYVWSVAWSPRSNEIAFIADSGFPRGSPTLYAVDIVSQEVTELGRSDSQSPPSWSPDGRKIVHQVFHQSGGDKAGGSEIVVIDRETRNVLSLGRGYYASWSPDGNLVAYLDNRREIDRRDEHICTMVPDGTGRKVVTSGGRGIFSREELVGPLVWSPDMRYIAYHALAGMKGGESTLYILDFQTKRTAKIFSGLDLALVAWKTPPAS